MQPLLFFHFENDNYITLASIPENNKSGGGGGGGGGGVTQIGFRNRCTAGDYKLGPGSWQYHELFFFFFYYPSLFQRAKIQEK